MKSYTNIEQSKKLAEILPLESADMSYSIIHNIGQESYHCNVPMFAHVTHEDIPCWSLAVLLDVLPDELQDNHYLTLDKEGNEYCCCYEDNNGNSFRHTFADNPVDACYKMIIKLHKLKML